MKRTATSLVIVLAMSVVSCTLPTGLRRGDSEHHGGRRRGHESGDGYVDRARWRSSQDKYLAFATEQLSHSSPVNVLAHLTRAKRDTHFAFDPTSISPRDFADTFAKIDAFQDTSDFDLLALMALWQGHRHDISRALRVAIEQRFLGFRYWYTDPLPTGVIDNKWFWTENHQIIFHTLEYLAGRALPDERFAITGHNGRTQAASGRRRIESWLDDKARWGFAEWHSDVYYQEDIEALTLLAEYGEPDMARRASVMLDVLLYDLAIHQVHGNNGVTHGRSYMKDKSRAADQDVFSIIKLLFATSKMAYQSRSEAGATFLAAAKRYRLPEVIRRVATSRQTIVDRTHMGAPLDLDQPFSTNPVSPVPGVSFTDPKAVPFWWQRGALTAWQAVPLTLATIDRYHLFDTELFKPFKPLVDLTGGDPAVARQLAYSLRCVINIGVLSEVDTMTWRSPDAMLSSAQDYRPGCFGNQYHAWQATLNENAVVFTTLPGNEPRPGSRWVDEDLYWSGNGAMPRSAQHGAAAIHLYAPKFAANGPGPLESFSYLPYTHAYFPTERFDEVRRISGWTIGRAGKGYVALWSWRPTAWRSHDPAVTFTNGLTKPFDLVAKGGANNAWIVEIGDAKKWGSFDRFVAAITAAPVHVTDLGVGTTGLPQGFDVTYQSPTEGRLGFSTTGPLTVNGSDVPLHLTNRLDNRFGTTTAGTSVISIVDGKAALTLNTDRWTRRATIRDGDR